jgi:IS605 OrfB family transposase
MNADYTEGVQLRYNYRLYPTPGQRTALARAFGCARVVFNDGLRLREEAHQAGLPYITDAELSARLAAVKATPERAWLAEVSAVVLQQALADLNAAYRNFFASIKGERKGPKVAPPRFRSRKDHRQAVRFTANARFRVLANGKLRLPKIGDARREFHHHLSTALIRDNQAVAVEDLAVHGLARTRMAKSVHDAGWSAFVTMLEYKARLYGREFHRIGRFVPTSQTCSACGVKDGPKPLHVRAWRCQGCGAWLDRDVNAAVNVARAAGLAVTACGARVRPGVIPAPRGEAGTHPKPRREAA